MRQAVTSRSLEHVNAVHEQVFFLRVGDDTGERVRQHTRHRAHEQDRRESHEDDHERWPKDGIDVVHDVETNIAGPKEDFGQDHSHAAQTVVTADERKGR